MYKFCKSQKIASYNKSESNTMLLIFIFCSKSNGTQNYIFTKSLVTD